MKKFGGKIIIAFVVLCVALLLAIVAYGTAVRKAVQEFTRVSLPVAGPMGEVNRETIPLSLDEQIQALVQDPRIRFDVADGPGMMTQRPYGDVYYVPEEGDEILIGESFTPGNGKIVSCIDEANPYCMRMTSVKGGSTTCESDGASLCSKEYVDAQVSPDGRFVTLTFTGWEDYGHSSEIYDVVTGEYHSVPLVSQGALVWLPDNRLKREGVCYEKPEEERVNGPYHMNLDCDWVEESVSADKPWEMKKVE